MQARQLLAASVGLVAFLAIAGYALDAAFADTARANLRERLKNYATAYAAGIDFTRDRSLYIREQPPDPRFDVPGSGLYLQVVMPGGKGNSMSAEGPMLPTVGGGLLAPRQEVFEGPLPMIQIDGSQGSVYRYGLGLVWDADADPATEFPYTIYVMEDSRALGAQLRVFRGRVWFWMGGAGLILLMLQTVILQWSLRPMRRVITELTKVQRGETERMSERHPRELEPLTDSINAFIESERENLERQRNTLADLAHSLKTPLAVLRTQLDSGAQDQDLRQEFDVQLRRMNNLVSYQLARAASSGTSCSRHRCRSSPTPRKSCAGWRRCTPARACCANSISTKARASTVSRATCRNCSATCWKTPSSGPSAACCSPPSRCRRRAHAAPGWCCRWTTTARASPRKTSPRCCSGASAATSACRAMASACRSCRT